MSRYPRARREQVIDLHHGHLVEDPYRWLEEADSAATRRWLEEQQDLSVAYLERLPGRRRLSRLLRDLAPRTRQTPARIAGTRRFRAESGTLRVLEEAGWRTVVSAADLHPEATIANWHPSPAGTFLAVQVLVAGAEDRTPLSVVDVATGHVVEAVEGTRYARVEWCADERAFFYSRRHRDRPGTGVYRHEVSGADELIVGDEAATTRYHVALWLDRWLVVTVRDGTAPDTRVSIADVRAGGPLRPLDAGPSTVVTVDGDRVLASVSTPDGFGQVLTAPIGGGPWRVLIPEEPFCVLAGVTVAGTGHLVTLRNRDGVSRMTVHDATTGATLTEADLPGDGTVSSVSPTDDQAVLALTYADWVTPPSVWHLDVRTGGVTPSEGLPARPAVEVSRHVYHSADGTEIPLTVLAPPGAGGDARPTLLAVYGGFGIAARPAYQPDLLAWVLSGGYVAVAGVRGGGERGRRWHREGSGANKRNALADLHTAGDWLVRGGWTRRDQLALLGGSNGGLLAMAAAVQRPDAYAAVGCAGAPLDMIRYERWGLGRAWREEYGSPDDEAELEALLSYSPYHNASSRRRRPAALLITGGNDTRVDPVHSRKMAAQLQHATAGGPVLHYVVAGTGHTGARNRRGTWKTAAALAFMAWHTGLTLADDA